MDLRVPFQNHPQAAARPRQAGASASSLPNQCCRTPLLPSRDVPATLKPIFRVRPRSPGLGGRASIRQLRLSGFHYRSTLKHRH